MKILLRVSSALALLTGLLLLGPFVVWATGEVRLGHHWSQTSQERIGLAPDPGTTTEAVVQVYAARAHGWRGLFAVHPWVAVKPPGADDYIIYQVNRWALRYRNSVVAVSRGMPDRKWYGNPPQLLAELRGAPARRAMVAIEQAVADYPYAHSYGLWPGPNSNTFVAWLGRRVPELRLNLPMTAIGKDYLGEGRFFDRSPSGTGWQLSLWGLAGLTLGLEEGLEINLLGTGFGIDFRQPALKLPGLGRIGSSREPRPPSAQSLALR